MARLSDLEALVGYVRQTLMYGEDAEITGANARIVDGTLEITVAIVGLDGSVENATVSLVEE